MLDVLAQKIEPHDEDGLDLTFTEGNVEVLHSKNKKWPFRKRDFEDAMDRSRPKTDRRMPSPTNMPDALNRIFEHYLINAERDAKRGRPKRFTLIILTDGKWSLEGQQLIDVRTKIWQFMTHCNNIWVPLLKPGERKADSQRPVSIQFVQFGDDLGARLSLRYLDNGLPFEEEFCDIGYVLSNTEEPNMRLSPSYSDVVDHEMFSVTGNINKMILGSFEPAYDEMDSDTDSANLSGEKLSKSSKSLKTDQGRPSTSFTANDDASTSTRDSRATARAMSSESRRRSIADAFPKLLTTDSG